MAFQSEPRIGAQASRIIKEIIQSTKWKKTNCWNNKSLKWFILSDEKVLSFNFVYGLQ